MSNKEIPVASQNVKMIIGIQPTRWTNDDFQEIGNDTPYQVILDQTKQCGYEGGSTGHNYPTHLPSLQEAMRSRGLRIASTWFGTAFTTGVGFDAAFQQFKSQIDFLKTVNATDVVVAELANAVNQVRAKSVLTDRPILSEPQWYLLTSSLNIAGKYAHDNGMQLSYHPHVGTCVMTIDETERLLGSTDPSSVALCLDTAHLRFGGASQSDLEQLTKKHVRRIKHVHLKNVRRDILPVATSKNYSFYQAIQEGIFTVPGDPAGDLDLRPILNALRSANYERWMIVEAEQNPLRTDPLTAAQTARAFLRQELGY